MDKIFHGNPSGIDNNVICFGGGIIFNKTLFPSHKNIEFSYFPFDILLIDCGVERNTS